MVWAKIWVVVLKIRKSSRIRIVKCFLKAKWKDKKSVGTQRFFWQNDDKKLFAARAAVKAYGL